MLAVTVTLMATWEATGAVFAGGLVSGGPVALVYGYILATLGTLATCLSMAELASMYVLDQKSMEVCCDHLSLTCILRILGVQQAVAKVSGYPSWPPLGMVLFAAG